MLNSKVIMHIWGEEENSHRPREGSWLPQCPTASSRCGSRTQFLGSKPSALHETTPYGAARTWRKGLGLFTSWGEAGWGLCPVPQQGRWK